MTRAYMHKTGFKSVPWDIWVVLRSTFRLFDEAFACNMLAPAPFAFLISNELTNSGRGSGAENKQGADFLSLSVAPLTYTKAIISSLPGLGCQRY